jgi:hypothetical protein
MKLDLSMFTPETLLDVAQNLRQYAAALHHHPDTAPDSWFVESDWISGNRARAERLALFALYLEIEAMKGGDL